MQEEVARLRLEQVRLKADVEQNRRLRTLLEFKERYVGQTIAAQVIGTSGSDLSRLISIDKGSHAHIKQDMAGIARGRRCGQGQKVVPRASTHVPLTRR